MKKRRSDTTRAAKLVTIFSTSLMIALGLCGVNFFAVIGFAPLSGPGDHVPPTARERAAEMVGSILSVTGFFEVVVILISLLGLVLAWLASRQPGSQSDTDQG